MALLDACNFNFAHSDEGDDNSGSKIKIMIIIIAIYLESIMLTAKFASQGSRDAGVYLVSRGVGDKVIRYRDPKVFAILAQTCCAFSGCTISILVCTWLSDRARCMVNFFLPCKVTISANKATRTAKTTGNCFRISLQKLSHQHNRKLLTALLACRIISLSNLYMVDVVVGKIDDEVHFVNNQC
jgi:hypothetical protein